jgi:hypothetical protein
LTLRYNAFGLTIAVRDYRPDRVPEPPPVDPEPPERLSGLFMVDALTREWGIMPRTDAKTVWALLPVGDSPTYPRAIRKAVHDAVRAVLAHGRNTTAAATALRQITARLTEQHGAAAARDLTDELARELAAANSAVAWINNGDRDERDKGDEHNGRDTRFDGVDTGFDDQHMPNPGEPGTP